MSDAESDRLQYLADLELPPAPAAVENLAPDNTVEEASASPAQVNDRSVISFVEGLDVAVKEDVMNSLLLGELAADHAAQDQADAAGWYGKFIEVLRAIGWTGTGWSLDRYDAQGDDFMIDKVVLDVLGALVTGPELAVVTATLNALRSLGKDDRPIVIFDTQSHDESHGHFQVGVVRESDGVPVLAAGAFSFDADQRVDHILWFHFRHASTRFYKATDSLELDRQVYSGVRDQVLDKLGDRAAKYVAALDLG